MTYTVFQLGITKSELVDIELVQSGTGMVDTTDQSLTVNGIQVCQVTREETTAWQHGVTAILVSGMMSYVATGCGSLVRHKPSYPKPNTPENQIPYF